MMKLKDLGFDQWFETHFNALRQDGRDIARVSAVDREFKDEFQMKVILANKD